VMVNGHLLSLETAAFTRWAALVSFNMSVNFCSHAIYVCLDSRLSANHHGPLRSTHIPWGKVSAHVLILEKKQEEYDCTKKQIQFSALN
jgi:hypothetical protein